MRFIPPLRHQVAPERFEHPAFAALGRHLDLLRAASWPGCEDLNDRLGVVSHPLTGRVLRFVDQTPALAAERTHYETRIHRDGDIATRAESWHDLFNALVWIEQPLIKAALNARQAADVARVGDGQRTRAQCALTHFDEAGVVVLLRDPSVLERWDAHDWHGLFWERRDIWRHAAEVVMIGHALLEHALVPAQLLVGKALVALVGAADSSDTLCALARAIADGALLRDPQELRPLPLSGLPGWHPDNHRESFHLGAPCYRPLRSGRRYPPPWRPDAVASGQQQGVRWPACASFSVAGDELPGGAA